jgi:lipoprotein-releasing system permease protein
MRVEAFLAWRFLREGRVQSLLMMLGATVGVSVIVFLSALIDGLQKNLIAQTLSTQPHVVVRVGDEVARSLRQAPPRAVLFSRVRKPVQRVRSIADWRRQMRVIETDSRVVGITPLASGPGYASRGGAQKAVTLMGVEPESYRRVYPVERKMIAGRFSVGAGDCVIGRELAEDLGVGVGEKLRLSAASEVDEVFRVAGIFDFGNREVNRRWVTLAMRSAQTLLQMSMGASSLEVRVRDLFDAGEVAHSIARRTGLVADSWTDTNTQLLTALRSQSASSTLIQLFVILGVAIGIASALVVSVVQRSRQIGILRAIGTPRRVVLRVFLLQGASLGVVGAVAGCLAGAALAMLFRNLSRNPDGSPLFPIALTWALFTRASLVSLGTGLVAAWLPARRAARIDPALAIRYE